MVVSHFSLAFRAALFYPCPLRKFLAGSRTELWRGTVRFPSPTWDLFYCNTHLALFPILFPFRIFVTPRHLPYAPQISTTTIIMAALPTHFNGENVPPRSFLDDIVTNIFKFRARTYRRDRWNWSFKAGRLPPRRSNQSIDSLGTPFSTHSDPQAQQRLHCLPLPPRSIPPVRSS